MKFLTLLERHLIVGLSAAGAMHVLMSRQQDMGLDMPQDTLGKRAAETAQVAVVFANALYTELQKNGY